MANKRIILKKDVDSVRWPRLTIGERYLYWGLTLYADDDGIVLKRYCSQFLFEKDVLNLEQAIKHLESEKFICTYLDEGGEMYIQILYWWDKQFIDQKMYSPSQFITCPFSMIRPAKLRKGIRPSLYDISGIPLEQSRLGERKGNESSLEENTKNKEDDLPF